MSQHSPARANHKSGSSSCSEGDSSSRDISAENIAPGASANPGQRPYSSQQRDFGVFSLAESLLETKEHGEWPGAADDSGARVDPAKPELTEPPAGAPADPEEPLEIEEERILPYNRRSSYVRIAHRLRRIRVLPAMTACFSALLVTSGVCGAEIAIRATDISSAIALFSCSTVACILAAVAAHTKSHVLLVGLVLLEVLFTVYALAFASVGLVNAKLLQQRQVALQEDASLQEEQRNNAIQTTRRMLIEQAVFAGLYFFIAAAHGYAAASVNHLRAAVKPFDSRLRRKRQRARAIRKLGIRPVPSNKKTEVEEAAILIEDYPMRQEGNLGASKSEVREADGHGSGRIQNNESSWQQEDIHFMSRSRSKNSSSSKGHSCMTGELSGARGNGSSDVE